MHRQATSPDRYAPQAHRPLGMGYGTIVHDIPTPRGAPAPGSPGVHLPSRRLLHCPWHQGPVHRLPLTVRTVFTALVPIMRTPEVKTGGL